MIASSTIFYFLPLHILHDHTSVIYLPGSTTALSKITPEPNYHIYLLTLHIMAIFRDILTECNMVNLNCPLGCLWFLFCYDTIGVCSIQIWVYRWVGYFKMIYDGQVSIITFPDATVNLSSISPVDEGYIFAITVNLGTIGGGTLDCELVVTLVPTPGTATGKP